MHTSELPVVCARKDVATSAFQPLPEPGPPDLETHQSSLWKHRPMEERGRPSRGRLPWDIAGLADAQVPVLPGKSPRIGRRSATPKVGIEVTESSYR